MICSENSKHRAVVELAAASGAHVLCEKPLATTAEDARAIVEACARDGHINFDTLELVGLDIDGQAAQGSGG